MVKSLCICLREATDNNGTISSKDVGQNVAVPSLRSSAANNNNCQKEMDVYVYFNQKTPLESYLEIAQLSGFREFDENLPTVEDGPAGNIQYRVITWIEPKYMEEFAKEVRELKGFIGLQLSIHLDPIEYKMYERYCTPGWPCAHDYDYI